MDRTNETGNRKEKEHRQIGTGESKEGILREPSAAEAYIQNAGKECPLTVPLIPGGEGHTEEEYYTLPDDLRVELIDGRFFVMDSPTKLHQKTAFEIARQLEDCIEEHELPCFMYIAPSDVALGDDRKTIIQPDIYVHCDRTKEKRNGPHRGTPDFVLEVLSPSNPEHDLWRKRELYQRHGVREYWIINPLDMKVYVFHFEKNMDPEEYSFDAVVTVHISTGTCKVDFNKVFQKIQHLLEEDVHSTGQTPEPEFHDTSLNYRKEGIAGEAAPVYMTDEKRRYTIEDLYSFKDEKRRELIDGKIFVMDAPSIKHQIIIGELYILFRECIRLHENKCRVIFAPCDVQLDKDKYTMVQPDILIVCDYEKIRTRVCFGAPDLAVEIMSPSSRSRDSILKLNKYTRAGVREYWIVDPDERTVTVYLADEDNKEKGEYHRYSFEDTIPVGISDGTCTVEFSVVSKAIEGLAD